MIDIETTGDVALDSILGGGLPSRSVVMLAGEPGSGKTVLTHQLLFHAARQGKRSTSPRSPTPSSSVMQKQAPSSDT